MIDTLYIYHTVTDAADLNRGPFVDETVGRLDFQLVSVDFGIADQGQTGEGDSRIAYLQAGACQWVGPEIQAFLHCQPVYRFRADEPGGNGDDSQKYHSQCYPSGLGA